MGDAHEWIDLSEAQQRRGEGTHFVIADRADEGLLGSGWASIASIGSIASASDVLAVPADLPRLYDEP